jgi:lipoprotein-anchoring transpeptidase ErfK/SrfK
VGATGQNVKAIEERLAALHYFVGTVDGTYGEDTAQAVTAFQKVHGMERTGTVTPEVWSRMVSATDPAPLVSGGAGKRVEVDVDRQVLFFYEGGKLAQIVAVSTGSEEPYCENGSCGDAVTPRGDFKIYRQGWGWETGPLGSLYNPAYFTGGFAIHGSLSVPPYPASHGCVRIPMTVAELFPDWTGLGTPVHVR